MIEKLFNYFATIILKKYFGESLRFCGKMWLQQRDGERFFVAVPFSLQAIEFFMVNIIELN